MGCIVSKLFWIFIYFLYLQGPLLWTKWRDNALNTSYKSNRVIAVSYCDQSVAPTDRVDDLTR